MPSPFLANWLLHQGSAPHLLPGTTSSRGLLFFPSSIRHLQGVTKCFHTCLLHLSAKLVYATLFSVQACHFIQMAAGSELSWLRLTSLHSTCHTGRNGLSKCNADQITVPKCLPSITAWHTRLISAWLPLSPSSHPYPLLLTAPHHLWLPRSARAIFSPPMALPLTSLVDFRVSFRTNLVRDFNLTSIREHSISFIHYKMSSCKAFVVLAFVFKRVNST